MNMQIWPDSAIHFTLSTKIQINNLSQNNVRKTAILITITGWSTVSQGRIFLKIQPTTICRIELTLVRIKPEHCVGVV